ncbi:MAG: EAL domain-containing protein [Pseudomonadota bacterium]
MDPGAFNQTSITHSALDALFPMHVVLDAAGTIIHVGPTLTKIMRRNLIGVSFFDTFAIKKPRSVKGLPGLEAADGRKIVVTGTLDESDAVEFRCLTTKIGANNDQLLIDFSFSADFVDLVDKLSLSSSDFKPNDFSLDLIYTIETQRALVEDSHKLTVALEDSRKEAEEAANVDVLTKIANRRALYHHLSEMLACSERASNCVLLHIDLDKFKAVNDNFGHAAGDRVLKQTAQILKEISDEADFPARIGGDEFAMIISGVTSEAEILMIANGIRTRILAPIEHDGHVFQIGVSIGVVQLNRYSNQTPEQLFTCSDIALYEAKRTDRSVVILTDEMRDRHDARSTLIKEIASGLEANQFLPFFQPKVDTRSKTITGMEVLARWQHPTRGLLPPIAFIEAAESANLMGAIERSIMKKAICSHKSWLDDDLNVGRLSFNLTAANLRSLSFVDLLMDELKSAELSPSDVELELLESVIFERSDSSLRERCKELERAGFVLALDDFGTGHASISTLIDNPISTIKIDRSFISGINKEERLQRITRSILALSKQLELDVVAEGVETQKELDVLTAFGCHVVQGFLFSRPTDARKMSKWLRAWQDLTQPADLEKTPITARSQ